MSLTAEVPPQKGLKSGPGGDRSRESRDAVARLIVMLIAARVATVGWPMPSAEVAAVRRASKSVEALATGPRLRLPAVPCHGPCAG